MAADYYGKPAAALSAPDYKKYAHYELNDYIDDVKKDGLEVTWDKLCAFVLEKGEGSFLNTSNFGEMYEIGLAIRDKLQKKKSGQYYTPDDVASVMSGWLEQCQGEKICDVACGTGKLILAYLDMIGYERARKLINDGLLYLYDFDHIALKICKTTIVMKYHIENTHLIHDVYCDFLDSEITLPDDCKVIANPPYARIENIEDYWQCTDVLLDTRELYSAFMEKIFAQAKSAVIITPFSFISGAKFYSLREMMSDSGTGFIVSFDNVPGNIFCGRKHGVFNTNTANSVRAAITVFNKNNSQKGYKVSPLIRFKTEERDKLLKCDVLEKTLPEKLQTVDAKNKTFCKLHRELEGVFYDWVSKSSFKMKDFLTDDTDGYLIDVPNTCRYFTTCSNRKLNRAGSFTAKISTKEHFEFVYCFINSSFAYWWWRIFDGGITYPSYLFNSIPLPFNLLSDDDKDFFHTVYEEMSQKQDEFIVTKVNAGAAQENIKFPKEYRDKINARILKILNRDEDASVFDLVHNNSFFGL